MISNCFASKRYITFFSASILALLIIAGCSKDDDDNGNTNNGNTDKISATIDGQAWESSIGNTVISGGTMELNAFKDDIGIQIFLTQDTMGTFQFPSAVATVNYIEEPLSQSPVFWNNNISGSITVVDNNSDKVSGTFNTVSTSPFNSDTIVLQNGSFNWQRN